MHSIKLYSAVYGYMSDRIYYSIGGTTTSRHTAAATTTVAATIDTTTSINTA